MQDVQTTLIHIFSCDEQLYRLYVLCVCLSVCVSVCLFVTKNVQQNVQQKEREKKRETKLNLENFEKTSTLALTKLRRRYTW